jgi:cation diffusion facilitator family transporter
MAVNTTLAMIKIMAGVLGNSYALVADGIESTADIMTSLVVWGGLRVAARPANSQHPYGYGKAETLGGLVTSGGLILAAIIIAVQSIREILTPHHLPHWSTLLVLVLVVAVKESMARWASKAGAEAHSVSLQADAWHHRSDALTSLSAFVGISIGLIGGKGYEPADDYAALVACLVILYSGLRLLGHSVRDILDVAAPPDIVARVRQVAGEVNGVRDVEKCRIRKSGTNYFVEIHIEVDPDATVRAGHAIASEVRRTLRESVERIADVLVHIEPHEKLGAASAKPK